MRQAGAKKDLTFDQFRECVALLEEILEEGGEDVDAESEAVMEQMTKNVFEELKDKKTGKVSTKAFLKWGHIQDKIKVRLGSQIILHRIPCRVVLIAASQLAIMVVIRDALEMTAGDRR